MRSLTYFIASTIDGFIAGPDRADPSGPGGFWPIGEDYVAHLATAYPETLPAAGREALGITDPGSTFDTVVEGRRTYGIGLAAGVTNAYPHLRHQVFSTSLAESPDPAVELVRGDPAATVRDLKSQPGKGIWLIGGGDLAAALVDEIDRLVVKLAPMTTGAGVPLFGTGAGFEPRSWRLAEHTVFNSSTAILTYDRSVAGS